MVYELLKDELDAAGGIHALQLFLKTPAEAGEKAQDLPAATSATPAETAETANEQAQPSTTT